VIRVAGSHSVIELMRQGLSPEAACKKIIERIIKIKKEKAKDIQVAFLAVNKKGQVGSFAIHPGFEYAIRTNEMEKMVKSKSWF
jgi:N4-(beta-N-acetylglucosaminyl)-L-asparaginase